MSNTARLARITGPASDYLPKVAPPQPTTGPEFIRASAYLGGLSPEARAQLEREWNEL